MTPLTTLRLLLGGPIAHSLWQIAQSLSWFSLHSIRMGQVLQFVWFKILNRGLAHSIKQTRTRNVLPSLLCKQLNLMESYLQQGHVPNTLEVIENFPLTSLNFWDPKEYYSSKKPALYNGLKFLPTVNVFSKEKAKKSWISPKQERHWMVSCPCSGGL